MAFHEEAGLRQVDFDLSFLKFCLSFMAEGLQSGPERSRARCLRHSERLTARTDLSSFRQEGKGLSSLIVGLSSVLALRPNPVATLPSALFDERSYSLGASWVFSLQPVLPPDCRPLFRLATEVGPGH